MKLLRLCAHEIRLNHPLPWGVRNEPGQLLLNKGFVPTEQSQIETLLERGVYVDAEEYERENRRQMQDQAAVFDPFSVWAGIQRRVGAVLRNCTEGGEFATEVAGIGHDIVGAIGHNVDIGKFEMVHNDSPNYAVTHSLQTACITTLVAARLGWSESDRAALINASLTMNVAMIDLQNALAVQATPLSPGQRQEIRQHARRSREMLEKAGVTDDTWLRAVEFHHVTDGGKPLPADVRKAGELACLIHYVDVYLAKLSSRVSRSAMAPNAAAREMFLSAGGANNLYAAAIVKEMGIYPPGSFVKLGNGETAVVVRSGEAANTPHVCSLVSSDGRVYVHPIPRDTARPEFKVAATVARSNVLVRLDRPGLYGLGR